MRALGFEVKKRDVVEMVRGLGKREDDVVDYDDFLRLMAVMMQSRDSRGEVAKVNPT